MNWKRDSRLFDWGADEDESFSESVDTSDDEVIGSDDQSPVEPPHDEPIRVEKGTVLIEFLDTGNRVRVSRAVAAEVMGRRRARVVE